MPICSHEFLLMATSTLLASWFAAIESPVRGLLRQLVRADVELADDLAQETFIRAYKHIRSFRGEGEFSTWLYRIAYNVFREHARKRKELVGIDEEQLQAKADPQTRGSGVATRSDERAGQLTFARTHGGNVVLPEWVVPR